MITTGCPPPPEIVEFVLTALRTHSFRRSRGTVTDESAKLPRPWEPATCSAIMREQIWWWCDDVAAWLNHDYAWRPTELIPACWPLHPHVAHELLVLACLRVEADAAFTPDPLETWHRDALPGFFDRMTERLGESCRTGSHSDFPAAARHDAFHSADAVERRQRAFHRDALQTAELG